MPLTGVDFTQNSLTKIFCHEEFQAKNENDEIPKEVDNTKDPILTLHN